MTKSKTFLVVALVLSGASGCLSLGASNITDARLSRGLVVFVEDSTDAWDRGFRSFEHGLGDRGTSIALEHHNWSTRVLGIAASGLVDRTDSGEAATDLARSLRHYALAYPGRPMVLVGHGIGCHVALNALEELDPRVQINRLVLLAPCVDNHRDLTPALERVSESCLVFRSYLDVAHGVVGPVVFGTHDTSRRATTAAASGFFRPEGASLAEYEKVHQTGLKLHHVGTLNLGTRNLGPTMSPFVRKYVRPFVFDGQIVPPEPVAVPAGEGPAVE